MVAVANGGSSHTGGIRAGARLGQGEAETLLTGDNGLEVFFNLFRGTGHHNGAAGKGVRRGYINARYGADTADFLHDQHVAKGITALSAHALGDLYAEEADFRHFVQNLLRENGGFFNLIKNLRSKLGFGKFTGERPDHAVLFGKDHK